MIAAGVDRDGAGDAVVVGEVEHQRLDVAVEDQADDLVVAVDDRAAGVAADDVGRQTKLNGVSRFSVLLLGLEPARRQVERRLVAVRLGVLEGAADRR